MNNTRTAGSLAPLYLVMFFAYLFGPLIVMIITAFNSASFPRMSPWECLTAGWFIKLAADQKLLAGIGNSLIIGVGVVVFAVPIGLAAAIVLSQVGDRLRAAIYTIFIAPILMPGVVIGLSTLIFWDRLGMIFGAGYDTFFYDGIFLTIAGQVTFISAYSMLVFLSRLQRFDPTLMEAALDMGATPTQAFVKILLPFMAPAIFSAAVLAFLASLENYNTTVFTIVAESTFTTVLASKVRYGLDPSISAVSVIIVGVTLVAATIFESYRRHQSRQDVGALPFDRPFVHIVSHPLSVALLMLALVLGAFYWINSHDSRACEADIMDAKRANQERLMQQQRESSPPASPAPPTTTMPAAPAPANGAFAPGNLSGNGPAPDPAPSAPASPFDGVFAPGNLAPAPGN